MIHTLRNRSVKPGYFKISSSTPSIFGTILARSIASTPARLGPWLLPLTTLLPQHLQPSDFRSLSGKGIVYANTLACLSRSQLRFSQQNNKATPFPEDAKGFWYLHPGPSHAPIAGELRFRIVESGNPEDFISGHDLVDVYGSLPWSIPLPSLLRHKVYAALASLLLLSGPNAHYSSIVRQINNNKMPIINTDATIIHSLGQPLYLDLSKTAAGYRIASGNKLNPSPSHFGLFTDWRKKTRGFTPYTGKIVFTFERAPGEGPPRCYVRVLDIIKPVTLVDANYDGHIPPPVKGELLRTAGGGLRTISKYDICSLPSLADYNGQYKMS